MQAQGQLSSTQRPKEAQHQPFLNLGEETFDGTEHVKEFSAPRVNLQL